MEPQHLGLQRVSSAMERTSNAGPGPRIQRATLIGLALVAGTPFALGILRRTAFTSLEFPTRVGVQLLVQWILTTLIVLVVLRGEHRRLDSIGVRRARPWDAVLALMGFVAAAVLVQLTMPLISALGFDTLEQGVRRLSELPVSLRLAAAVTAGITEEILFRGFLVERLASLTGRLRLGALLSWALFTVLHIPGWGVGGALQIGIISTLFYLLYLRRRSIVPCVLMHVMNDLYAFLVVPLMLPEFP